MGTEQLRRGFYAKCLLGGTIITGFGGVWYYKKYHSNVELSQEYFTQYRISYNQKIDSEHFILELTPIRPQSTNMWALMKSDKLWSVQVKQPEIMVVRNYTPLPLQHVGSGEFKVLADGDNGQGKLSFYLKKYQYGEVARWLSRLPEGHILELRGPYIDYEFPSMDNGEKLDRSFLWGAKPSSDKLMIQPFDISAFTAGTGIAPIMQLLLTEFPFRGRIHLFHSCRQKSELGPLGPILDVLRENNRVELNFFESSKGRDIRQISNEVLNLIDSPSQYLKRPFTGFEGPIKPVLSLICGPDSYITTISGPKYDHFQGPIEGLLGQKGWSNQNVFKLS